MIVKHANPCGVAVAATPLEAYDRAYRTDPTSAFGGIIAFNRELDAATAQRDRRPAVRRGPRRACGSQRRRARSAAPASRTCACWHWATCAAPQRSELEYRSVTGGLLAQTRDHRRRVTAADLKVVTRRQPTASELADLLFAWRVCKFVKSNAIVFARERTTHRCRRRPDEPRVFQPLAAMKAADEKLEVAGSVMASDAFFPFRDGLDVAAEYGIRAVIQPGGSQA